MLPSSLLKLYFLHLPVEVLPFATLSGQKQNANYLNGFSVASGTSGRFSLRISSGLPPTKIVQTLPVGLRPCQSCRKSEFAASKLLQLCHWFEFLTKVAPRGGAPCVTFFGV